MITLKIPKVAFTPVDCLGIHANACLRCPSARGTDPESEDIKSWPHFERVKTAFPCAWRPNKHCKGYCDVMGISAADLEVAP